MKIIKNDKEYELMLARVEELVDMDPEDNTPQAEEFDLLTLLINKYEDEVYPIDIPDPVDAIKFRMEQQGLKYVDMVPYFGSKSRVSEVLNRKRSLSLSMIRKLNQELGIPAEVLIAEPGKGIPEDIEGVDWKRFPVVELVKNGWIDFAGSIQSAKENSEELIRGFFSQADFSLQNYSIFFRKSLRSDKTIDEYGLAAWYAKVLIDQNNIPIENKYKEKVLDNNFFDELRMLSFFDKGPVLAQEYLLKFGIKLLVVPHLKGILIDGAVFFNSEMDPVIGLTLRYDRLDYFWFTLFHELAHLALHLKNNDDYFFDDLSGKKDLTDIEKEADSYAEEMLIKNTVWQKFYKKYLSEEDIKDFARKERISPSIFAGRIQKERDDYSHFRNLLGQNQVKRLFEGTEK
ncbi:MAG: ImmA/IrrE family metallo-endopeptidase [Spirochaetia bacterium]|jgi:HTH-type transcriptional regulator/antitoxin HigA|nr:ImmA/IrrE family metallo-endopeptidase [Spirochaetia bacterium]